jgi:hypothetical protein
MVARFRAIAVVGVGLAILLTITAAPAATKQKKSDLGPPNTPMTTCARDAGIYFDAYTRKWLMNSGAGNPQEQAYYGCLDRIANPHMKKR